MRARIYQPARNAMQSGTAKTHVWMLDFAPEEAREIDPLMGWTGSGDTQSQVRLKFDSREAAEAYAKEKASPMRSPSRISASPTSAFVAMAKTSRPIAAASGRTEAV